MNPRLAEAAQALGAARWQAELSITVALSVRGTPVGLARSTGHPVHQLLQVVLILGRGQVLFVADLIYSRFADLANYPGGAAMSMIMLGMSLLMIYLVTHLAARHFDG